MNMFFFLFIVIFLILMSSFLVDLETIKKTLGAGGNVLLPADTAGRVLELLLILEQVSRGMLSFLVWLNVHNLAFCKYH